MAKASEQRINLSTLRKVGYFRLGCCLLIGLIGAWLIFALAVSGITRVKSPEIALMFVPADSTALAERADQLLLANLQSPPPLVRELALASLRGQAINPKALRILGFYADLTGNNAYAEILMQLSARQSRRETGTQLWLIEAAARKNDDRIALTHYDIALRTEPDLQAVLFPRLLAAIEDRQIRLVMRPFIRQENNWAVSFLSYANANSKNLPALVELVLETGGLPNGQNADNQRIGLMQRLVSDGYFSDVPRVYLKMPGAKAARLANPSFVFSDLDSRYGPVGWQLTDRPDAGGSFNENVGAKSPALSVFANSGTTYTIATRLLFLAPGSHIFSAKLTELQLGERGFLRWQLRCLKGLHPQPIWSIDSVAKAMKANITIPSNCTVQSLELIVSGGQGQTGLEAKIASISINTVRNNQP